MSVSMCPPVDQLRRLGNDTGTGSTFRRIESHVDSCVRCQEMLERLALIDPTDSLSGDREGGDSPPPEIPGFVITKELGRGGYGVVYEAVQTAIGRRVAIKVLPLPQGTDGKWRRRWLREAKAMSQVRHPNVVRLHEVGEHDGRPYLVLDLIPGGSLKSRMTGPIPPRESARIVETIARAADSLHRVGVLHLDIKPSNILIDAPEDAPWEKVTPILSDFGIALAESELGHELSGTANIEVRGTPSFMAPEQVTPGSRLLGPAADVFALGATLYTLLTGRPPFQAASTIETFDLLRERDPVAPRTMMPSVPKDLETICLVCLEKDPARRYGSAGALAEDLGRWLDGHVIAARPVSRLQRLMRWRRRHPAVANLAASLLLILLGSIAALTTLWRQSVRQSRVAEGALARALESDRLSDDAVTQLIDLTGKTIDSPEWTMGRGIEDSLPAIFELTSMIRQTPELPIERSIAIATIELKLANHLRRRDDTAACMMLFDDAIGLMSMHPEQLAIDPRAAGLCAAILTERAYLYLQSSNDDRAARDASIAKALSDLDEATRLVGPHAGDPQVVSAFVRLLSSYLMVAQWLDVDGRREQGTEVLRKAITPIDQAIRSNPDQGVLKLLRAVIGFYSQRREGIEPRDERTVTDVITDVVIESPLGQEFPDELRYFIANLFAWDICDDAERQTSEGVAPQAIAGRIIDEVSRRVDRLGGKKGFVEKVWEQVANEASTRETRYRHQERFDEALGIVEWLLATGKMLRQRMPASPSPHILLAQAYERQQKHLWRPPVFLPRIEQLRRLALEEMSIAVSLDPGNEVIRERAEGYRKKYIEMVGTAP